MSSIAKDLLYLNMYAAASVSVLTCVYVCASLAYRCWLSNVELEQCSVAVARDHSRHKNVTEVEEG